MKYNNGNGQGGQEMYTEEDETMRADGDAESGPNGGVERLPVSIAELNIKPYKCLHCGFRSDRKSDTLRHIRVKHEMDALHAFKFLRIMSIKEASETIDQYESTRVFRKSTSRVVSRDYALINSLVQHSPASLTGLPTLKPAVSASSSPALATNSNNGPLTKVMCSAEPAVKTTLIKQPPLASVDYFRCPICLFKHRSRLIMKKHLANHYFVSDIKVNPVYQCNVCGFKAAWQFIVKKHILSCHVANPNAHVVRLDPNKVVNRLPLAKNKLKVDTINIYVTF